MYVVITERVFKVAKYSGGDRFAARTTNQTQWAILGPFSKRSLAERAAVAAAGTHTCLSAAVYGEEDLSRFFLPRYTTGEIRPFDLTPEQKAVCEARTLCGIPDECLGEPLAAATANG